MSTKSNNGHVTTDDIDDLFRFSSEKKEIEHEARMIMFRFLSEIERVHGSERGFKKQLAKAINKSSSFVTQLYNGDKLVNLITLAKFQKKLGIKFKITAFPKEQFELIDSPIEQMATNIFVVTENFSQLEPQGLKDILKNYPSFVQVTPKSELHTA